MADRMLMLNIRRWTPGIGCLLAATLGLVGCAPKTNVSATGNVPAAYSHVYMSVQEIWFNTSATAGPDDTTWAKYPLTTPTTVDLATSVEGTLNSITTGLAVPVGTYAQIRLIPVDASATLLSSASALGATYNSEVDYTDSAGTLHQLPLELLNPDKGIGVATTVQVKGDTTNVFSSTSSTSTSTSTDTSTSNTNTTPTIDPVTGLPTTDTSTQTTPTTTNTSTGTTPAATFKLAINVDGAKDLVPFTYNALPGTANAVSGMLLNPHTVAYDQSEVGAISGTLDVTNLTGVSSTSTSSYLNIQVTAESLSADGTRHIAVNSAPVTTGGTFTVYPLSTSSSSPTSYDLVIHGPGIATVVVKDVTVNVGDPSSTTPVNIGTITPRAATSFTVNLNASTPLPAGALVGFYQTLPGSGEVPYLIDAQPIDPFSRTFNADQAESTASLDYGTFASGANVTLTSADPTEGASTYRLAGTAPLFTDGVLTTTVKAPSASTTTATIVAVPTLTAASGAALNSTTFTIGKSSNTKYNMGNLIISHDGAIVATARIDSLLTQSATGNVTISGIPGGSSSGQFADGLYYVSVRAWNSASPATTLNREIYPTPLDLRTGNLSTYSLTVN
ncbi:MAG TPA: DUF4382 domain-containing protein [Steroidobacteraceae bacterium]|nr:DUF4382 domain-containing protein [Steroidobacteraceae bacterium]